MIWSEEEEHTRRVVAGEKEGKCPGCGRETTTFVTVMLPNHPLIGCCCAECIDGETIERLDPRQNARLLREALLESDRRWRERQGEA